MIVDSQQLDKCNNNLAEETEALGKPRNKASETLSKHSSNSSSGPLSSSSSTLSSSSDVVSTGGVLMFRFLWGFILVCAATEHVLKAQNPS